MRVLEKSSNGIIEISADAKLFSQRRLFIEGKIDAEAACDFAKSIMLLNSESIYKPIDVLINSPGGEINSGLAIYDAIQGSKAPIRTFCIGKAYSMGAVLLACGSCGRYMLPNSELMLHEPLIENYMGGSSSSIKSVSDSLLKIKQKINCLLAKHTGRSEEEIEKASSFDHFLSPEESKDFGLCDEIVGFDYLLEGL